MSELSRIIEIAKNTISLEAESVASLANNINDDFVEIVNLIHNSKERVIITGIGKSGVIAMKIVATMNSTGTPAVFMHAAEAIHGDLGIIQENDLVICISKSGNSKEIKELVPHIIRRGNTLIGMTGEKDSFLAKKSNYLLLTPVKKEACPNDLAPTTSTTVQLAMGDALAMCLLDLNDFKANDFAQFHPGGALGKKLHLTMGELLNENTKPAVRLDTRMKDVIFEISEKRLGAAVVLDGNKIMGMITDGDIRRILEKHDDIGQLTAEDLMSKSPISVNKELLAVKAFELMTNNKISQIIVIDDNKSYEGIVHILDFIKEGLN
ncbi:KpsF/GutQ family sugar-phosphate isomerase [Flavobacteriaceae bacterium]|nr:KpsF/GutQ family sugar-phosphate isomerase [Flavobacteriaceae bacterium]